MNAKIVTLWGSSGSGKTTAAVNLALALASRSMMVALVSSNLVYGELQTLFKVSIPDNKGLPAALVTGDTKNQLVQVPDNDCLYLLGIPDSIDALILAGTSMRNVTEMLDDAAIRFDALVIDGSSDINNPVSGVGLVKSDAIYTLCRPCVRTIAWHRSMKQTVNLLNLKQKMIYCLNAYDRTCDRNTFISSMGEDFPFDLPFEERMPVCDNTGLPLYAQHIRHGREYRAVIDGMADALLG